MSYTLGGRGTGGDVRINIGDYLTETTSLSGGGGGGSGGSTTGSSRSLLMNNRITRKVVVDGLKNNKKSVGGVVGIIAIVAISATYIGMQHSSMSVAYDGGGGGTPSSQEEQHRRAGFVLPSKPKDYEEEGGAKEIMLSDSPKAMALESARDKLKGNGDPKAAPVMIQQSTKVPPPYRRKPEEFPVKNGESNRTSTQRQNVPTQDAESEAIEETDKSKTQGSTGGTGNLSSVSGSSQLQMDKHHSKLEEIAAPPKPPKRQKAFEVPVNASSMHPKSVINNMHLPNQTYWRYDCLDGRTVVGYKILLTFVFNETVHEYGGFGEKLKEAETAAAQYALHDLWKVSYETRPATLPDEVKELCPKTPSNKDKTAGESNISLEELYANYRKTAAVQLPKKVVQELPKNPMKLDPKSLVYQMKLDSFNSYKVPCLDGRSTVGFKCVLTFIDSNSTLRQFEGYGKKWKDAEKEAARLVSLKLWDLHYDPIHTMTEADRSFCPATPTPQPS